MSIDGREMKVFGITGWSGSGKTTLLVRLIPELIGRGLSVSTMKHTHHNVDLDTPGKDSWCHRQAGAKQVMVASSGRWTLINEYRGEPETSMTELIGRMGPVDLLLVEGFKRSPHPKLEVYRREAGKPLWSAEDPSVLAIATCGPPPATDLPVLDLKDVPAIADFVIDACGLSPTVRGPAGVGRVGAAE